MDTKPEPSNRTSTTSARRGTLILLILLWTLAYNVLILGQRPGAAFFGILDTISDQFVMGTLVAIVLGVLILVVFSITKLYTQMIVNVYSFRILEDIVFSDVAAGRFRSAATRLVRLDDEPCPGQSCPQRPQFILLACGINYFMSWVYVILFAEALFFVSWSAGVDLEVNDDTLLLLPTLALALPFSARVMAYLRYPYAQDYADFMPGALFVLLLVAGLGYLFGSPDQDFFLRRVYSNDVYLTQFVVNGVFLAFVPVFFEIVFWLFELATLDETDKDENPSNSDDP